MIRLLKLVENEKTRLQEQIESIVTNELMYRELSPELTKFKYLKSQENLDLSEYNLKMHLYSLDSLTVKSNLEKNLIHLQVLDLMLESSLETYIRPANSCRIINF